MKKMFKLVAVVLGLVMLLSGCSTGGDEAETVKIGFLGAQTGDMAIYGLGNLKGIQLAVEEINADGGILGKQIELLEDDDVGAKDQAINITNRYITKEHVNAIIGDPLTGLTRVAGQIANDNQTVIMSAGCTGNDVVEIGEYVFRNTLLDSVAAPATMDYMINELGLKKVAIIESTNSDYSVSVTEVFKESIAEYGGEVILEVAIQDGDTDFSAQVTLIQEAEPDVIVFGGYYTEAALIMKKVREVGMDDIIMVGGDGYQSETLFELGGDAVNGVMSFAGFSTENPTEITAEFIEKFEAKFGEEPDLFAANGYDAVYMIAKAMEEAGSIESEEYKDELAAITNYEGVSGTISFRESDHEAIKSPVFLLQAEDGAFKLLKKVDVE